MGIKEFMNRITQGADAEYDTDYNAYDEEETGDELDSMMGVPAREPEDTYAKAEPVYTPARPVNISGSAIELKVVKPESYKNASQIADHLLSGRTVVLNLENTNKETARRLIDFLTGAAYSIGGDIKKVSNNTYVITPGDSVAVSGDKLQGEEKPAEQPEEGTEYFEL